MYVGSAREHGLKIKKHPTRDELIEAASKFYRENSHRLSEVDVRKENDLTLASLRLYFDGSLSEINKRVGVLCESLRNQEEAIGGIQDTAKQLGPNFSRDEICVDVNLARLDVENFLKISNSRKSQVLLKVSAFRC